MTQIKNIYKTYKTYKTNRVIHKAKIKNRRMVFQRIMGAFLLILSIVILKLIFTGQTLYDQDGTILLLFIPLGLTMLFSNKVFINY